jgi:hypothetical protein
MPTNANHSYRLTILEFTKNDLMASKKATKQGMENHFTCPSDSPTASLENISIFYFPVHS